uniref:Uncharacterized protein n=1 Tax=Myotis myotis TaxID=51298 RepID=A0A7J7Z5H9_MYOMY|nr:hypothetical protein mMyoMyo1_010794 [Myotis myotis]
MRSATCAGTLSHCKPQPRPDTPTAAETDGSKPRRPVPVLILKLRERTGRAQAAREQRRGPGHGQVGGLSGPQATRVGNSGMRGFGTVRSEVSEASMARFGASLSKLGRTQAVVNWAFEIPVVLAESGPGSALCAGGPVSHPQNPPTGRGVHSGKRTNKRLCSSGWPTDARLPLPWAHTGPRWGAVTRRG